MTRESRRTTLVWLLRLFGIAAALALPAVFLPTAWMGAIHERLGLGAYPDAPITDYLARSLSLFYALFGGLLIVVSLDVDRWPALVRYVGCGSIGAGVCLLGIDLHAGLPWSWTLHEGPMAAAFGAAVLWLSREKP